ncbi:MAG: hypothetical protein JWM34_1001 [Ilumatobacteraceae bacterium]|nr:hypothetical protein [Ilumatobacteraceae bacterium]
MKMIIRLAVLISLVGAMFVALPANADGFPTTDGQYSGGGPLGAGATMSLTVLGRGGVPASGVGAVAVNVTATGSTADSYLSSSQRAPHCRLRRT